MGIILKFIMNIILFIPRLILNSISSLFSLIILLLIMAGLILYFGNYSIKGFITPTEKVIKVEPKKE